MHATVLVPTYARPAHLRACLAGLTAQDRPADEVIVVVQENDHDSWKVLADHPEVRPVTVDRPGVAVAINAGLDALAPTEGDGFVAICDDDTVAHPQWLATIESHFVADPTVGGVGGPDHPVGRPEVADGGPDPVEHVGRFRWFGRMEGNHHRNSHAVHDVEFLKGCNHSYRRTAIDPPNRPPLRIDTELRGSGAQPHNDLDLSLAVGDTWRQVFDPAAAVDHHDSPSPDRDLNSRPPSATYDGGYNKVRVVRRRLGWWRALATMPWELACGDGYAPGPWRAWRMKIPIRRAIPMVASASMGKIHGLVPDLSRTAAAAITAVAALVVVLAVGSMMSPAEGAAAALLVGWVGAALIVPRATIVALVAYAGIAAWLRRLMEYLGRDADIGVAAEMVMLPIVVVGAVLAVTAVAKGALARPTPLLVAVSACVVLAVAGAFNPRQGALGVGVVGLVYLGLPFLWFYVGRIYADSDLMRRLYLVVVAIALPAAAYGVIGFSGRYTAWDRHYYENSDWVILLGNAADNTPRPIGFMTSPEEFGRYLALAVVVLLVMGIPRLRGIAGRVAAGVAALFIVAAIVNSGVRMAMVFMVAALVLVLALWRGWSIRTMVIGALAVPLVVVALAQGLSRLPDTGSWTIDRQIDGFAQPWNREVSTLPIHVEVQTGAIRRGLENPLGVGTGRVTPAAERFGSEMVVTEGDLPNATVAWGPAGFIAYAAVLVAGVVTMFRIATRYPEPVTLVGAAVLVVMAMRWSYGGIYALVPLVWLTLGWFDRRAVNA